jgi:S1-C subfamily serine protease
LKKVPVLFFFSGMHRDYHRPTDDADKINYDGMQEVVDLGVKVVDRLLMMPKEQYVDASDTHGAGQPGYGGSKVTLGVVPDYGTEDVKGVQISGTVPGSPAAAAGLKGGDVIIQFGSAKLENIYDLTNSLAKGKPGDKVKLTVVRDGKNVELEATLAERKG